MSKGILKQIDHSEWDTLIIPKSNVSVRICDNYRDSADVHTENGKYPLLNNEKIFGRFSKRGIIKR